MAKTAVVKKVRGISPIWTLPLIALAISGWLIYSAYVDAGTEITITFEDASGIVPDKTQIMARGIPIGLVKELHPDLRNNQVKVVAEIDHEATEYLVEDTMFWIVRPVLSASSVQGLETILSGSYIGIRPGLSSNPSQSFEGLANPPPVAPDTPGLHIQIRAEALGSIQVGTGIYYRNIEIGKVQRYQLDNEGVLIDAFIEARFSHLVKEGSRFSNASGIQIGGKLPNLKIQVESLASLLKGGILLHTPEPLEDTPQVASGHVFSLYPDQEAANYGVPMTLTLASSEDIVEGSTKVMYRGLEAGYVKEIKIDDNPERTVTASILLDPRAELILRENTRFWMVKPQISAAGISNVRLLLAGAHITFQPGDGPFRNHFDILAEPPPQTPLRPGRSFVLTSGEPTELAAKSPVYYKNIQVGEVVGVDFAKTGESLRTTVFIYDKYLGLVGAKSVFWMQSGIEVNASLSEGLAVSTGPLARLLQGGVSFTTPDNPKTKKNDPPEEGFVFPLHDSYKEAVAAVPDLQPAGIHFTVAAKEGGQSLGIGSPILHKNIKIGEIEGFKLARDQQSVLIECFVTAEYKKLVHENTRFYNLSGVKISGGLGGIDVETGSLQALVAGGIGSINMAEGSKPPKSEPYPLYADLKAATHADEVRLTMLLTDTHGLKEGSPVRYKGIQVGKITEMTFADNLQTISATANVEKSVAQLFRADTKVWVEKAEVGLSGVKNAETLVFGPYLNVLPGNGSPARTFTVLAEPPRAEIAGRDGFWLVLFTKNLGSLSVGAPVYYRQIEVGQVTGYQLSPGFQEVQVFVNIANRYKPLIRQNTRFWKVSGTRIEGGIFSGLTFSTESLEALLRGGIALATPGDRTGQQAEAGERFPLVDNPEKEWLDWSPSLVLFKEEQAGKAPAGPNR